VQLALFIDAQRLDLALGVVDHLAKARGDRLRHASLLCCRIS
jgi:hypothetical protein